MSSMPERKAVLQLLKEHPVAEEKVATPNEQDSRVFKVKTLPI